MTGAHKLSCWSEMQIFIHIYDQWASEAPLQSIHMLGCLDTDIKYADAILTSNQRVTQDMPMLFYKKCYYTWFNMIFFLKTEKNYASLY